MCQSRSGWELEVASCSKGCPGHLAGRVAESLGRGRDFRIRSNDISKPPSAVDGRTGVG
jgi:hypothetical protein